MPPEAVLRRLTSKQRTTLKSRISGTTFTRDCPQISGNRDACDLAPVIYVAAHVAFDLESMQQSTYIAETPSMDVADKLGLEDTDALAERIDSCRVFVAEAKAYL